MPIATTKELTVVIDGLPIRIDGRRAKFGLSARCDPIPVDTLSGDSKLDPLWTFTDAAGHFHAVVNDEKRSNRLPTLKYVKDGEPYYIDGDEMQDHKYVCVICDEDVEPGHTYSGPSRSRISGPETWEMTLEGTPGVLPQFQYGQAVSVRVDDAGGRGLFGQFYAVKVDRRHDLGDERPWVVLSFDGWMAHRDLPEPDEDEPAVL